MEQEHPKLTAEEKRRQYMEKWKQLNIPMGAGEEFVQMEEGDGKYFLTNWARVISLSGWHGKPWRDMTQHRKGSKNSHSGTDEQLQVDLMISKGKWRKYRVSRLMAKYFRLSVYNPLSEEELQVHHKKRWNPELYTDNNRVENLQLVGAKAHSTITMIQDGVLDDNGLEYKNNSLVWKKIGEIAPDAEQVNVLISKVDKKTNEVTSSEGATITYEDAAKMFSGISFEGATIQWDEKYRQRLIKERKEEAEAMKLIAAGEATGKVRVVNGHLQLVKDKKGKSDATWAEERVQND